MTTRYSVWCSVTDKKGVTRSSWLKESKIVTCYATEKAAADAANRLQTTMNRSAFHDSKFVYEAREYDELS
jgi:hypothetical protein